MFFGRGDRAPGADNLSAAFYGIQDKKAVEKMKGKRYGKFNADAAARQKMKVSRQHVQGGVPGMDIAVDVWNQGIRTDLRIFSDAGMDGILI